jgi:hypothetical protein
MIAEDRQEKGLSSWSTKERAFDFFGIAASIFTVKSYFVLKRYFF